jgi:integrating conjugative element protein (TIGR03757 family)
MAGAQGVAPPNRTVSSTLFDSATTDWKPGRIEVFATTAMFVSNAEGAMVYRVDGRKQLINEINQGGLPPNQQQASAIVRQRVKAMGPEFNRRVEDSLQAVEKTMVYGVQRVPAVVVDGRRVVYGVTDVKQAVDIVRRGGGQPIGARFVPGRRSDSAGASAARPKP